VPSILRRWWPGQLGFKVDVDSARHVPGHVVIVTSRVAERPADVKNHRRRSGFEAGGELVDTD